MNRDPLSTQKTVAFGDPGAARSKSKTARMQTKQFLDLLNLEFAEMPGVDFGGALETAGGIVRALPQLEEVFWVAAGDVFAPEFEFSSHVLEHFKASPQLAHLWLVPNPAHNLGGDFGVSSDGLALNLPKLADPAAMGNAPRYTFSTIALYKRAFFEAAWCDIAAGNPLGVKAPLAPMLRAAMDNHAVSASFYTGAWTDVGTPQRLAELNACHF